MEHKRDLPNAVQKALRILMAFRPEHPVWGVRELSSHLNFSLATVHRLLRDLKLYSFVEQDPETRRYRLGNIYFHFLLVLQSSYPFIILAKPLMKELAARTQETVHLNLIEGGERICIESVESPQRLRASMPIGERSPLYAGASAKCLLAFSSDEFLEDYLHRAKFMPLTKNTLTDPEVIRHELQHYRNQGYVTSQGERTLGLASITAPIFDHGGVLLASLSVTMPELRYEDQMHRDFCLQALLETAGALSKAMGYDASDSKPTTEGAIACKPISNR
jgi:IclR family KDG regulon transcriptional repressor